MDCFQTLKLTSRGSKSYFWHSCSNSLITSHVVWGFNVCLGIEPWMFDSRLCLSAPSPLITLLHLQALCHCALPRPQPLLGGATPPKPRLDWNLKIRSSILYCTLGIWFCRACLHCYCDSTINFWTCNSDDCRSKFMVFWLSDNNSTLYSCGLDKVIW